MIWQDIVISASNLVFAYSLFYQVVHGFREKKGSMTLMASGLTATGLYAMAASFLTLELYFSTILVALNGTLWLALFVQGLVYEKA
jgi:hypothetical protein